MKYIAFYLICEIVLSFAFAVITQLFYKRMGFDFKSMFKGMFERVFLGFALYFDYPHALTFFSALKLATRLKHKETSAENENRFNDFYIFGNFLSVLAAILYVEFIKNPFF